MWAGLLLLSTVFVQLVGILVPPFGLLSTLPFWAGVYIVLAARMTEGRARIQLTVCDLRIVWLILAYLGLQVFALTRGYLAGVIHVGLLRYEVVVLATLFCFGAMAMWRRDPRLSGGLTTTSATYLSVVLFVTVNLVLFAAGLTSEATGFAEVGVVRKSVVLGLLGFDVERVVFLLASGVNYSGLLAGAALLVGLVLLSSPHRQGWETIAAWTSLAIGLLGALLVDSRAAFVVAGASAVLVRVGMRFAPGKMKWLAFVLPLTPLLLLPVLGTIAQSGFGSALARSGTDIQGLNGRLGLWVLAAVRLGDVDLTHLIGYGYFGQITSGISLSFANLGFGGYANPEYISLHNVYLQTIFDSGYIGLVLLLSLVFAVIGRLTHFHRANPVARADVLVGVLVYYLMYGNIEVAFTQYHEGYTLFFLIIMLAAALPLHGEIGDSKHRFRSPHQEDPGGGALARINPHQ